MSIDCVMKNAETRNSPEVVTSAISTNAATNLRFRCEPRIPRRRSAKSFQKLRVTTKIRIRIRITITPFRNRNRPLSPTPCVRPVIDGRSNRPHTAATSTTPIQNSRTRRRRSASGSGGRAPGTGSGLGSRGASSGKADLSLAERTGGGGPAPEPELPAQLTEIQHESPIAPKPIPVKPRAGPADTGRTLFDGEAGTWEAR